MTEWRDIRRKGGYTGTQEIERDNILGRHKTRLRDRAHKRHRKRTLYIHIGNQRHVQEPIKAKDIKD